MAELKKMMYQANDETDQDAVSQSNEQSNMNDESDTETIEFEEDNETEEDSTEEEEDNYISDIDSMDHDTDNGTEMELQSLEYEVPRTDPSYVEEFKFRLQMEGVLSIDFIVPPHDLKWYTDFFNAFEIKYCKRCLGTPSWNLKTKWDYFCLICRAKYPKRWHLLNHMNRHMGFYIVRCHNCLAYFFSLRQARRHAIFCVEIN